MVGPAGPCTCEAPAATIAYYSVFYAAEAALAVIRVRHGGHQSTIDLFGRRVCAGEWALAARFHQTLKDAYDLRLKADYIVTEEIDPNKVDDLLTRTDEFLSVVFAWIADRRAEGRP